MTNSERIRNMTDEELADIIGLNGCRSTTHGYECPAWDELYCEEECKKNFLAWLRKEADENAEH